MKRFLKLILTGILLFCTAVLMVACGRATKIVGNADTAEENTVQASEPIRGGAYFITETSWESYVRTIAEENFENEEEKNAWIEGVLNGGDGGELCHLIANKRNQSVAVVDGQMSISGYTNTVYRLMKEDGAYTASSYFSEATVWAENDFLYVSQKGTTTEFLYDDTYTVDKSTSFQIPNPEEIELKIWAENNNRVTLFFTYEPYSLWGLEIAVYRANTCIVEPVKIEKPYMNQYTVELSVSDFNNGWNEIYLRYIGGPRITRDKTVVVYEPSESVKYKIYSDGTSLYTEEKKGTSVKIPSEETGAGCNSVASVSMGGVLLLLGSAIVKLKKNKA